MCDGDGETRPILANAVPLASDRQRLGNQKETQTGNSPDRAVGFCGFCPGPCAQSGGRAAGGRAHVCAAFTSVFAWCIGWCLG